MKAAVFYGKNDLRVEERDVPEIGRNDVLVRVHACGICGTDVHIFCGDEGAAPTPENTVLGHEFAGEVVKVGADVPYCIMRGTALAEGIGEKLTRLPEVPKCYVLIGKPGINVSTKTAYENLNLEGIGKHPDIDGLIGAIRNNDLYAMASRMENVFEPGIIRQYPVIGNIKNLMEEKGALKAVMSGSGPTVFGIFDNRDKMAAAARSLRKSGLAKTVFATDIYNRDGGVTNDK